MHSFSANSKGEEALLHPQNSYSQVIQKKDEGVDKMFLIYRECCLNRKRKKQCFKRRKAAL
jgi:hypothetical protein